MEHKMLQRRLGALAGTDLQTGSLRGIEKECLRVTPDGLIARSPHPKGLGSALTHRFITTDFSEALLEFISPPLSNVRLAIQFLCDLHQFACAHVGDEVLWAASMPCRIRDDADIPLARYGESNIGRMKTIYRRGLGYRYGRYMQAIAGLHYNFSMPESFWPHYQDIEGHAGGDVEFRSEAYLGLVRNLRRFGWLLMYMFGASPAICRSFTRGRLDGLEELDGSTLYGPWATSLRMSDIGYHNASQARVRVSANSLDEYIRDLERATRTESPDYARIGVEVDGRYRQLNANELQIENEYYSSIRPKRVARGGERPSAALRRGGVEYVELRLLDLNPFEPVGINQRQAHFVEAFLWYCLLQDSPPITAGEAADNEENQALVAQRGREPGLQLRRQGRLVALADWSREIVTGMLEVCEVLDGHAATGHADSVREFARALDNSDLTPSARQLAELRKSGQGLFDHVMALSQEYTDYFRALSPETNGHWGMLTRESRESMERQAALEAADNLGFSEFLSRYLA